MKLKAVLYTILLFVFMLSACAPQPPDSLLSGEEPTQTPISEMTAEMDPTSLPEMVTPDPASLPSGVLSMGVETVGVRLTMIDGKMVDEWHFRGFSLPASTPGRSTRFHYGGTTQQGVILSPCIFLSSEYGNLQISFHESKSPIISLQKIQGLINLVGAPRQPLVVFSAYDPENLAFFNHNRYSPSTENESEPTSEPAVVDSWLYAATLVTVPESELLFSRSDENGFGIYPLVLNMDWENLKGIWYTMSFQGLYGGGPIIYKGFRGLYYLDIETKQEQEVLDMNHPFLNISSSQTLIAYKDTTDENKESIVIQDLETGTKREIEILPGTFPTGIGSAQFSPSDAILAWQEHYLGEENIGIVIRFASILDGELFEIDSEELISAIADPEIYHIRLAGWLDDHRIIFEAHTLEEVDLYILDLSDMSHTYLAPGQFIGFTYP